MIPPRSSFRLAGEAEFGLRHLADMPEMLTQSTVMSLVSKVSGVSADGMQTARSDSGIPRRRNQLSSRRRYYISAAYHAIIHC